MVSVGGVVWFARRSRPRLGCLLALTLAVASVPGTPGVVVSIKVVLELLLFSAAVAELLLLLAGRLVFWFEVAGLTGKSLRFGVCAATGDGLGLGELIAVGGIVGLVLG